MPGAYRNVDATVAARRAEAVTLSDSAVIENTRSLYVGSTGDLAVVMVEGTGAAVTFKAVPAGTVLPIQVIKVMLTNSTVLAGTVLALY